MRSSPSLAQIKTDLHSENQETRGWATQSLLIKAQKDPGVHAAALPLFQMLLATAADAWTITIAARGVELIQGTAEGRKVWLTLIQHPNDLIAANAILAIDASTYVPELMQLLATRPEPRIHFAVVRGLGRTKNPQFLPTILSYLHQPGMQVQTIIALQELEDPRALTSLKPLIQDNTDSGMTDDRGCLLRIGDLAADAVRRLEYVSGKRQPPIQTSASAGYPLAPLPSTSPTEVNAAASPSNKFQFPRGLFPYVPLIAALVEIPWVAVLVFTQLFLTGAVTRTRMQTHFLDALSLIPPLIGLATALLVVMRYPTRRRVETICLGLGSVLCALIVSSFGWELFH